jgi:16S rRNA G966 N2-methylase RsmD
MLQKTRSDITRMSKRNERLTGMMEALSRGWSIALFAESCDRSVLAALDKSFGLEGRLLFIGSDGKTSGAALASKSDAVFCGPPLKEFLLGRGVSTIDRSVYENVTEGSFAVVDIRKEKIEKIKSDQFISWLERYKRRN